MRAKDRHNSKSVHCFFAKTMQESETVRLARESIRAAVCAYASGEEIRKYGRADAYREAKRMVPITAENEYLNILADPGPFCFGGYCEHRIMLAPIRRAAPYVTPAAREERGYYFAVEPGHDERIISALVSGKLSPKNPRSPWERENLERILPFEAVCRAYRLSKADLWKPHYVSLTLVKSVRDSWHDAIGVQIVDEKLFAINICKDGSLSAVLSNAEARLVFSERDFLYGSIPGSW